jgi:hypothetical protein
MSSKFACVLLVTSLVCLPACAPDSGGGDDDNGGGDFDGSMSFIDADPNNPFIDGAPWDVSVPSEIDAGNIYPDASGTGGQDGGCSSTACPNPVPAGCGGTEICGNGSDDNCNGKVDEGCPCQAGSVQNCFANPPGYRHVGACMDGQQTCEGSGEFTQWGPCTGGILPKAEACDSLDNNCNGCVDDNPLCCEPELECPASMPDGTPFTDYVINGAMFNAGTVTNWTWTVTGGPCDQLLAPSVSYTLNGAHTTTVSGATTSVLTFRPTLSGDYTVKVVMKMADGTTQECTFIVHIKGPGLRIELCWDTTGDDDIDLHVHRPDNTSPWFNTTTTNSTVNNADCYYANCKAVPFLLGATSPAWGYANSPLAECSGGPEGAQWQTLNYCRNPRLDLDNIFEVGRPENINIDNPQNGKTYRVAVHHYSGSGPSHPLVNVYCGGTLKASYGKSPDTVGGFTDGGGQASGPLWRVVDVTPAVNGAGDTTDCALAPLHASGQTTGYNVTCPDNGLCKNIAY